MKKKNPWILISIILGILCVAVISLYVLMFISGSAGVSGADDFSEETEADGETGGKELLSAKIPSETEYEYKEFDLEGFEVSYSGDKKAKKKDSDDDDNDEDEDNEDRDDDDEDIEVSDGDFILPESASRELTEDDLEGLSAKELTYARNEIYARHGRLFNSQELQDYFSSKDWYEKDEDFDDHDLRGVERENAEFISQYQQEHDLTYKAN